MLIGSPRRPIGPKRNGETVLSPLLLFEVGSGPRVCLPERQFGNAGFHPIEEEKKKKAATTATNMTSKKKKDARLYYYRMHFFFVSTYEFNDALDDAPNALLA